MEKRQDVIDRMVAGKYRFAKEQAGMSFADKIRALIRMQKANRELQIATGRKPTQVVWGEPSES